MLELLRKAIVMPFVVRWLAKSNFSWRTLPRPNGAGFVEAPGADPDRILLAGSGIAVGYGVDSHDSALAGQLASQLSESSGRGVHVEVLVGGDVTTMLLKTELDTQRLRSLDAIVATLGDMENLLLLPGRSWRREIESLLDHISANGPDSLHVFLVGAPPLARIVPFPRLLGALCTHSAHVLDRRLASVCASRANATFIPFVSTGELAGRDGTGRAYRRWAQFIAPVVGARLARESIATAPVIAQESRVLV